MCLVSIDVLPSVLPSLPSMYFPLLTLIYSSLSIAHFSVSIMRTTLGRKKTPARFSWTLLLMCAHCTFKHVAYESKFLLNKYLIYCFMFLKEVDCNSHSTDEEYVCINRPKGLSMVIACTGPCKGNLGPFTFRNIRAPCVYPLPMPENRKGEGGRQ